MSSPQLPRTCSQLGSFQLAAAKLLALLLLALQVVQSFDSMGLKEELLRGLYGYGFEKVGQITINCILPFLYTVRAMLPDCSPQPSSSGPSCQSSRAGM